MKFKMYSEKLALYFVSMYPFMIKLEILLKTSRYFLYLYNDSSLLSIILTKKLLADSKDLIKKIQTYQLMKCKGSQ